MVGWLLVVERPSDMLVYFRNGSDQTILSDHWIFNFSVSGVTQPTKKKKKKKKRSTQTPTT